MVKQYELAQMMFISLLTQIYEWVVIFDTREYLKIFLTSKLNIYGIGWEDVVFNLKHFGRETGGMRPFPQAQNIRREYRQNCGEFWRQLWDFSDSLKE